MRKYINWILFLGCCLLIIHCNEESVKSQHDKKDLSINSEINNYLPKQVFTIDTQEEYSLITKSGCVIDIPSGSIESNNKKIDIVIQEAIGFRDIIASRLQTKTNGNLLSSGGMIYISVAEGQQARIKKALKVKVPTENYNNHMQVYDGILANDGTINWKNPKALSESTIQKKLTLGESLYSSNCASCHRLTYEPSTGPSLLGIHNRRSKEWIYAFTRNSAQILSTNAYIRSNKKDISNQELEHYDYYADCIYTAFNKTSMTAFPNLQDDELDAIFTYLKNETDKQGVKEFVTSCDSCEIYQKTIRNEIVELLKLQQEQNEYFSLQEKLKLKRNVLIANGNTQSKIFDDKLNSNLTTNMNPPNILSSQGDNRASEFSTGVFYEMEIQTFGWKNIDILVTELDNVITCQLQIKVLHSINYKVRTQLLIPEYKISSEALRDTGDYFSLKPNNQPIQLPVNTQCYILAISEKDEKLYFDIQKFTAKNNQNVTLSLNETSPQNLNQQIDALRITGLTANIHESNISQQASSIDKEIEKYKVLSKQQEKNIENSINKLKQFEKRKPKSCFCGVTQIDSFVSAPYLIEEE